MAKDMEAKKAKKAKKAMALVAAGASAVFVGSGLERAFATVSLAPRSGAAVSDGLLDTKALRYYSSKGGASSFELQLATGFPDEAGPQVGQADPWATCFATVEGATMTADGTVQLSTSLEQWVMRGDRQSTDSFRAWRSRMANRPVDVRCSPTSLKNVEDVTCLECVSHVGGLPFTADSPLVPSGFLVSDLQQCVRRSFDGTGFCKSASLVV